MTLKTEKKLHPGDTLNEMLYFKDEDEAYFDPTSIATTIKDPSGATIETYDIDDLSKEDTGQYILAYNLSATADTGTWSYTVKAVYGAVTSSVTFLFSVNPMSYGSLSVVRDLCGVSDDSYDYSLLNCMEMATAEINDSLTQKQISDETEIEYDVGSKAKLSPFPLHFRAFFEMKHANNSGLWHSPAQCVNCAIIKLTKMS